MTMKEKAVPGSPQRQTLRSYTEHASDYLKQWDQRPYRLPPLLGELLSQIPQGTWVLDLGCGPAQDSRFLDRRGFRVVGLDGTWPFLRRARRRSRRLPLVLADLSDPPFRSASFGGIWAGASLIHLPKTVLRKTLRTLHNLTEDEAWFGATFSHGTGAGIVQGGWIPGRYFSFWRKEELARAIEANGWTPFVLKVVSNQERKGRWLNLIARKN